MKTAALLALLAVALVPVARIVTSAAVRREAREHPLPALALVLALTAAALGGAWMHTRSDWLLPMVTAVTLLTAFAAWWRARPQRGSQQQLPPGSLAVLDSLDALSDPEFYRRRSAQLGSVFKMAQFHRPTVVITDLPLGLTTIAGNAGALAYPRQPLGRRANPTLVAWLNDPRHPRHRAALNGALNASPPDECREALERNVRAALRQVADDPTLASGSPDRWIPLLALSSIATVLLGTSFGTPHFERLREVLQALDASTARSSTPVEDRLAPAIALIREISHAMHGPPPAPSVLGALVQLDPRQLEDDVVLGNLALLLMVTRENVIGVLRWSLKELLDHPAQMARLRTAAATDAPARVEALSRDIVREVLRLHQSEFFLREVVREIRVGEFRVPRGWLLRVDVREGHRDPSRFRDPDAFRPERFEERTFAPDEYAPFSDGTNSEFGGALALRIARTFVHLFAAEFDGRVLADGAVMRGRNRHWGHWRPSVLWRVEVSRRSADPRGDDSRRSAPVA